MSERKQDRRKRPRYTDRLNRAKDTLDAALADARRLRTGLAEVLRYPDFVALQLYLRKNHPA